MKRIIPLLAITIFGLLSFGSCKKSSSSNTCTCKGKSISGQDTTITATKVDSGYTSLSAECSNGDSILKAVYGSGYGCHM
jgi:hypothetical protein